MAMTSSWFDFNTWAAGDPISISTNTTSITLYVNGREPKHIECSPMPDFIAFLRRHFKKEPV